MFKSQVSNYIPSDRTVEESIKHADRQMIILFSFSAIAIAIIVGAAIFALFRSKEIVIEHRCIDIGGCLWVQSKQNGNLVSLTHHPKCINHTTTFR